MNPGIIELKTCKDIKETKIAKVGGICINPKRYIIIASPLPKPLMVNGTKVERVIKGAIAKMTKKSILTKKDRQTKKNCR